LVVSLASLIVAGCGVHVSPAPATPATVANVYIACGGVPAEICTMPGNSTGAPAPANTITIPGLNAVNAIAVDSVGNIYAATGTDIREYAAGATGTATPIRTIPFDATTTLSSPLAIAVDSAGAVYASQLSASGSQISGSVLVFSSSANGSVPPIRVLSGALTGLVDPMQIELDGSGNLYVYNLNFSSQSPVLVFASGATGNVAPIRSLNGPFLAIAVDSAGDIYTLSFTGINIYAPGASGSATPTQIVPSGSLGFPAFNNGLGADSAGNIYYTSDGTLLNNARSAIPTIYRISPPVAGSTTALNNFTPAGWSSAFPLATDFFVVH
jgi:hypothetical protein